MAVTVVVVRTWKMLAVVVPSISCLNFVFLGITVEVVMVISQLVENCFEGQKLLGLHLFLGEGEGFLFFL